MFICSIKNILVEIQFLSMGRDSQSTCNAKRKYVRSSDLERYC